MKQLISILLIAAMIGCKKDDTEPAPVTPAPITQANTTFNIKSQAYLKLIFTGTEIKNYTGAGQPNPDTSITKTITSQNITFSLTGQITTTYPVILTINSGHKYYTFIDSTNKGERTIALW